MSDRGLTRELERAPEAGDLEQVVAIVAAIDACRATLYWDGGSTLLSCPKSMEH
ncbi:MAG TPA: hypothetical protein VGQ02_06455 [Candidatus Limnocylindrales bacterium]|jgi:hypothetical protein|nr:hypothetical protein [Candidatus Limnocylindrales bacterium]